MKKFLISILFCYGSISLFAEEATITTVTTVKTDGETTVNKDPKAETPNVEVNEKNRVDNMFRSQLAITRMLTPNDGLEKNSAKIEDRSRDLNIEQKYLLLNQYKKEAGVPFVLNMMLGLGIGSFVQGDTKGGLTGLLGELGSFGVMMGGSFFLYGYSYNSYTIGYIMMIAGVTAWFGFRVYELVRPWTYARDYNEKLEQSLRITVVIRPYLNLAETLGPSYGAGVTAHF